MPDYYSQEVKERARQIDPECWKSYSGRDIVFKRQMEERRTQSLSLAKSAEEVPAIADYESFSQKSIEKSIREMLDEVKQRTGATEEQVLLAFQDSAKKFMDVNCFLLDN